MTKWTTQIVPYAGLNEATCRFFGIVTRVNDDGEPVSVVYPYPGGGRKVRLYNEKKFFYEELRGHGLWGKDKFSPGSAQAITITEGEKDAASVYQMLGSKYPAVSVRSASQAREDCSVDHAYLNSFEKIYLCLDNDEVGQRAVREVAALFDVNKVYHVKLGAGFKDANDYLTGGKVSEFTRVWWNAARYKPKNILNSYEEFKAIIDKDDPGAIASYPFPDVEAATYGIRSGELILFKAQQKIGKTEIFRALEHHLLKTTDFSIGMIHLEDTEKRMLQGLLTYELKVPVHLPTCTVSRESQFGAFLQLTKRDHRVNLYTHFGTDDPEAIVDAIRYMVGVQRCKFVFLDHLSNLAVKPDEVTSNERQVLDYLAVKFASLVKELDFTMFLISHVNDDGKTRGSRYIAKTADLVISLDRDKTHEDERIRNTTHLLVEDNRFSGMTGPAGDLYYDRETGTLGPVTPEMETDHASPF